MPSKNSRAKNNVVSRGAQYDTLFIVLKKWKILPFVAWGVVNDREEEEDSKQRNVVRTQQCRFCVAIATVIVEKFQSTIDIQSNRRYAMLSLFVSRFFVSNQSRTLRSIYYYRSNVYRWIFEGVAIGWLARYLCCVYIIFSRRVRAFLYSKIA